MPFDIRNEVTTGGIVRWVNDDKVGFEVNIGAPKEAGIKLSSKLLARQDGAREAWALGHACRRLGASDLQGWPSVTAPIPHHGLGCRCR